MTPEQIRRAVAMLPLDARRTLVQLVGADLELDERVMTQADWFSFRLRAAWSKR